MPLTRLNINEKHYLTLSKKHNPANNRIKGHNLERLLVQLFKRLGYQFAKTSRLGSKILDYCKIDLAFVPLLIQAKNGYKNAPPKYATEYKKIKAELVKNFPKEHPIHQMPIVLVHKIDGYKQENFQWTWNHTDMVALLEYIHDLKTKMNEIHRLSVLKEEIISAV